MKVIAADSAAAILDEKFVPQQLVSSAAVLVESPYREAEMRLAEPIFREADNSFDVIVNEAQLCQTLLEKVRADVVHLDTSLGSFPLDELSPVELANLKLSNRARANILKILPTLRKIAGEIRRKHGLETLAIGKESVPVRVAELTAGSEAVLLVCDLALEEKKSVLLGLPVKCEHRVADGRVYLHSLIEAEHDVRGHAHDRKGVLGNVELTEILNPTTRGFRALRITPNP